MRVLKRETDISLTVDDTLISQNEEKEEQEENTCRATVVKTKQRSTPKSTYETRNRSCLNPLYTFDSFIEGSCNRLARSAAMAIAQRPGGTSFNPFVVYGGVGLGKTHLVQAIGNYALSHIPVCRTVYVSSEQFTSQFVKAIRENAVSSFSSHYRNIDLLIVDDIQFLAGKEKTQEEFFHIFNTIHQNGKQIVLCLDRSPAEIDGFEERLLSRFKWGLSIDIKPPDYDTRIAILKHKSIAHGISIPHVVLEYVADHIEDNIRLLEGALSRLIAYAKVLKGQIHLERAKEMLNDLIGSGLQKTSVDDIIQHSSDECGITTEQLLGRSRQQDIVKARQIAIYLTRQITPYSLSKIGKLYGGRDHTTVLYACNKVQTMLETDAEWKGSYERIHHRLNAS